MGLFGYGGGDEGDVIESSTGELLLRLDLDKSAYRPGEAVLAQVTVINTTDRAIEVRALDQESVTFWFGPFDGLRRVQRQPVVSNLERRDLERGLESVTLLEPGQEVRRPFLLTLLAREPGRFVAQAHMDPFRRLRGPRVGILYSNPIEFLVYGDRLFERDAAGLIHLEEAIGLAAAAAPGDIVMTDAILVEDEMGFYKWWVNVDYRAPDGEVGKVGYLIDPYQGRVWSRAQPFADSMRPAPSYEMRRRPRGESSP